VKIVAAFIFLCAMGAESFDVGVDAYFLNLTLSEEANRRPFQSGSIGNQDSLFTAVGRVILNGLQENHSYWVQALKGHHFDDRRQHINTVSAYSCAIECIDSYMFLQDDIAEYNSYGGGARRVLCKRCVVCYYASVLMLQLKLQSMRVSECV
jgi:hypothetical protein